MNKIEQIKAEIERRQELNVEQFKKGLIPVDTLTARDSQLLELKDFINSLPQEHPSEDLEKAACKCAKMTAPNGASYVSSEMYAAFKCGAKWQKEQDDELLTIAHLDGVASGRKKEREQMMKDAVNGEVVKTFGGSLWVSSYIFKRDGFKFGDRVRIIVVKED